ncbi:DNA helicase [Lithospermum erythrorhizon]|uniref:DNA helicase n=1 Tax=Lithospermum erythrorhizon TaxID=34254 RepID=A0AAV3R6D3_LITER
MVGADEVKNEELADSPTSVLEEEHDCSSKNGAGIKVEDVIVDSKNGDSSLITEVMAKVEENLLEERVKEEEENNPQAAPELNDIQFTKLDELLTQTQLYSEFLLEKMDDITTNGVEDDGGTAAPGKGGRGAKRKAAAKCNNRKAKRAVAAMLTRSKEGPTSEDSTLTEEQKIEKEQSELVPLLTGGKLKSYQIKGVKWLISLWQNGLNGILADQMGLGKTIQTIAFLAHLKGNGLDGPYLVIAPLSTLSNWMNEITRFVPTINAIIYHGGKKERDDIRRKHMPRTIGPKFPIVITSYEVVLNNARKHLSHYNWKYLVVDELRNMVIQLRKNCNHPDLLEAAFDNFSLYPPVEEIVSQCGKFRLLDKLLVKLFEKKHKVLIFSQWTKTNGEDRLMNSMIDWNPQMDLQAMDRCHRIGQTKPVHVYRLATAQSVEGRMLKRAFSKLRLEHVVIGKGEFKQERTKAEADVLEEEDLLALLRDDDAEEDRWVQTDISDEDLERVLDRSDLIIVPPSEDKVIVSTNLFPLKGPGWEVVVLTATGGMLSTLNS